MREMHLSGAFPNFYEKEDYSKNIIVKTSTHNIPFSTNSLKKKELPINYFPI